MGPPVGAPRRSPSGRLAGVVGGISGDPLVHRDPGRHADFSGDSHRDQQRGDRCAAGGELPADRTKLPSLRRRLHIGRNRHSFSFPLDGPEKKKAQGVGAEAGGAGCLLRKSRRLFVADHALRLYDEPVSGNSRAHPARTFTAAGFWLCFEPNPFRPLFVRHRRKQ